MSVAPGARSSATTTDGTYVNAMGEDFDAIKGFVGDAVDFVHLFGRLRRAIRRWQVVHQRLDAPAVHWPPTTDNRRPTAATTDHHCQL